MKDNLKLEGLTRAQRARFARTELYGHREVRRTAAWSVFLERVARGGGR